MKRLRGFSTPALAIVFALVMTGLSGWVPSPALGAPPQPSYSGPSGLLRIPTTETLPPLKFALGAFYDFQIANHYPGTGTTILNVLNLTAGVGILPRGEVSVLMPIVWWQENFEPPVGGHDESKGIGDVSLNLKYTLLRDGKFTDGGEPGIPLNFSILATYKAPTGNDDIRSARPSLVPAQSTGKSEVSVMGIVDVPISLGNKDRLLFPGPLLLTGGVGGSFPFSRHSENNEPLDNQVIYQAGAALPIFGNYFFKGERLTLEGSLHGGSNELVRTDQMERPRSFDDQVIQAFGGIRYAIGNGLAFGAGVDVGVTEAVDDLRGIITISWSGPVEREEVIAPERPCPPAAAAGPAVEKIIERERLILPDVNFEFDKSRLTPLGKGKVYLLVQRIKTHKSASIVIEGHCDERGTEAYNMALGMRRAERVKGELVRLGIPEAWVQVQSYGESRPLIPEHAEWAWSVNRRVEVVITPTEGGAAVPSVTPAVPAAEAPAALKPVPPEKPAAPAVKKPAAHKKGKSAAPAKAVAPATPPPVATPVEPVAPPAGEPVK